ncbi:hypothetical protein [Dactylosporangium salmoneum]|uniref:Uncharacterized protein n=1 Tax=Dactylosporangium salmoneum TaxID=53361 RepID=A0ABN3G8P2_9ACTN
MSDLLAALRRDLEQMRYDAAEAREQGWDDAAVGAPMFGEVAA